MKKLVLSILTCIALTCFSQETNTLRFGIQAGFQNTKIQFDGGMGVADFKFNQNKFDGSALSINMRYDINTHWMGLFGLGFNTFGFNYPLPENYPLYSTKTRFSDIKYAFKNLELPFILFYKFKPNCKNAKWLVGGGVSENITDGHDIISSWTRFDGINTNSFNSISYNTKSISTMMRLTVSRERVFKKGSILNFSLLFNYGFNAIARSNVSYTINGQNYNHDFKTNGTFIGLRLTCFFKPL